MIRNAKYGDKVQLISTFKYRGIGTVLGYFEDKRFKRKCIAVKFPDSPSVWEYLPSELIRVSIPKEV